MKINEIEGFPKSLLKKKELPLYKAFVFENPDDEMKINTNIDILAITKEAAIAHMLTELPVDTFVNKSFDLENLTNGMIVSLAVIKLNTKDFIEKDVIDNGDVFFENDLLSITLQDKLYSVDVEDVKIETVSMEIEPETEKRIISNLSFSKA